MNTEEIIRQAREEFKLFLALVWHHLNLPPPTQTQREIAEYLQYGGSYLIVHAYRGVGKSWITAAFVCWLLWRNPKLNILVVSATGSKALEFANFTRRLIAEMPLLRHLQPRKDQRDSIQAFDVNGAGTSQAPSVKSLGITSQITGSRADYVIADDVEIPTNSLTAEQREKLLKLMQEFISVLKPETGQGRLLGTPQSMETIYNALKLLGYQARYWPARVPAEKDLDAYGGNLAPSVLQMIEDGVPAGTPTDDQRFTEAVLREKEALMGRAGFALQFQLNTAMSDQLLYPLRMSDFIVMPLSREEAPARVQWAGIKERLLHDLPNLGLPGDRWYAPIYQSPEWAKYSGSVLAIDPSGMGSDEVGYAIVKQLHGNLFVFEVGGLPGGYKPENLRFLAGKAKDFSVNAVVIEKNFGDGMFAELLKPIFAEVHPCEIIEVHHHTQKEKRICDTLEPLLNTHRLVIDQSFVEKETQAAVLATQEKGIIYNLFHQMTRMTRQRGALAHDDRIEALAMACNYFVEAIAQDDAKRQQEMIEERDQALYDQWMDDILSGKAITLWKPTDRERNANRCF